MSRSRKKTKIHGMTTAKSEKKDKRVANRKFRRVIKYKIKSNEFDFPKIREVSDVWLFNKDGKVFYSEMSEKDLRK